MPSVPKPQHNRRVPKNQKQFSPATIKAIFERDQYCCVRCGNHYIDSIPHHVIYRSAGGTGHKRNGITVCRSCHKYFHDSKKQNNIWAEKWVELNLDEQGNLIHNPPKMPGLSN